MPKLVTEMKKEEIEELISKQVLDEEEQEIEDALAAGLYVPPPDMQERLAVWKEAAANTRRKRSVTMRFSNLMIDQLKAKAQREGMPYQTLVNSVLHKYLSGRLVERD
jgi:predicted DNA binding CopG/RHH family protein